MLNNKMSLKEMMDFKPNDTDMVSLPLNIVTYIKSFVVSYNRDDNINFIRYLFTQSDVNAYFNNIDATTFYDFDGSETKEGRFVTCFEVYGLVNAENEQFFLNEVLKEYENNDMVACIFEIYTHDNKKIVVSNY